MLWMRKEYSIPARGPLPFSSALSSYHLSGKMYSRIPGTLSKGK
jgi:hypothetical protein